VDRTWEKIKPIVVVGVFSLLVALLVLAFMRDKIVDWQSALIAGYLSDSTLQRISQAVL
jgi:putative effector of murein hydrolase LrgA (UPF0299 family)